MGIENDVVKIMISAAIGGTAEALGGGKFANGAVTGAYVMILMGYAKKAGFHETRQQALLYSDLLHWCD
jgi:hypothetical protein